ncbi:histidine kinase dimerization/phosphoacceptor domain -containing protein [Lyngbya aestuarii]|uniref:histidine kinase dimerization/phosphoacceptor domain -containing protein n=1 Tax=Lyngbya aestuarii TaxID=118322 RepID=UPI00403DDAB9
MKLEDLQEQIHDVRSKLGDWQQQLERTHSQQQQLEIMAAAFTEIDASLAKVQVTAQELYHSQEMSDANDTVRAQYPSQQELLDFSSSTEFAAQFKKLDLLHTVVTNAPIILYAIDSNGIYTLTEGKGLEVLGKKPSQAVGQSIFQLYGGYPSILENIRSCLEGRKHEWIAEVGNLIFINKTTPLRDRNGQIIGMIGVATDITEQHKAETALRQSEKQLRLALEAAQMAFWDWDIQTGKVSWSGNFKQLYGLPSDFDEGSYEGFLKIVHPEDRQRANQDSQRTLETKRESDFEYRIIRPDGSIRWVQSKYKFFYDQEGNPVRKSGIDLDITERKLAELKLKEALKEKEILLKEIHHRVKNNLQIVSSLLELQSMRIDSPVLLDIFRDCQNRVESMAMVHQHLYQTKNLSTIDLDFYIQNLVSNLFKAYNADPANIAWELDIDNVTLNVDYAISCGLILNELISNALKHAFDKNTQGKINVLIKTAEDNHLTMVVRDDGKGLSENWESLNSKSLGFQIVNALVSQLEGTLEHHHHSGTEFFLKFPCI